MAQELCPEAGRAITRLRLELDFPSRIMEAYIPSLPPAGREGPVNLIKYCRIVGLLFRAWVVYTKGQDGWPGLRGIIDDSLRKRNERIAGMSGGENVERIVDLEGRMMMVLAMKLERDTGVM
jgi:hypothetical protein